MSVPLRNPYALVNGEIVHVNDFDGFMSRQLKCPNCDNSMVYVSETKRGNSICRAHFRHNGDPCPNDEYEKSLVSYKKAKQLAEYRKLIDDPPKDIKLDTLIEAMIEVKPSITTKCCVCGKLRARDLSSGSWEKGPNSSIVAHLKYSKLLLIEFEDISVKGWMKSPLDYSMIIDRRNPTLSIRDNLFPCKTCTDRINMIMNAEMEERAKLKNIQAEESKEIISSFVDGFDETIYFVCGKYVTQEMKKIWEIDRSYFFSNTDNDSYKQTESWFLQKFGERKMIVDLIGYQLGVYYEYLNTERVLNKQNEVAIEMREERRAATRKILDRMGNLEERFEDYLTCTFPKYKGISYYRINKSYLGWIINEISVFKKLSTPQQFFILDAYLSRA